MNYNEALKKAEKEFNENNKNLYIFEIRKLNNFNYPDFFVSDTKDISVTSDSVAEIIKCFVK